MPPKYYLKERQRERQKEPEVSNVSGLERLPQTRHWTLSNPWMQLWHDTEISGACPQQIKARVKLLVALEHFVRRQKIRAREKLAQDV
jgi:hypothetical protein